VFSGSSNSSNRVVSTLGLPLLLSIGVVLLYTLFVGWGLLTGNIPVERAYILLALLAWCPRFGISLVFCATKATISAWLFRLWAGFWPRCYCLEHMATGAALARGLVPDQASDSPASWFFAFLSIAAMLGGAFMSWRYWLQNQTN
jgi:hypothetical protein